MGTATLGSGISVPLLIKNNEMIKCTHDQKRTQFE